jgi:hypothetical protein
MTSPGEPEANALHIKSLYRERADAENVFDKLKNQWCLNGFYARSRRVSALAARLLLLVYNLWTLSVRLLEPGRHVEAAGSRRWFFGDRRPGGWQAAVRRPCDSPRKAAVGNSSKPATPASPSGSPRLRRS